MVALLLLGCAGEATEKPAGRERDSGPATDADSGQDSADTGEPADTGDTGPVVDTADTGDTAEVVDDADGDGFRAQDGDCDDARANVYPGAPDGCDALDQDCDGEAIPAGACGEEWDPAVSASWVLVGDAEGALYSAPLAPGDLDGDGLGDVVYEQFPEKSYSIGFLSGGSLDWSGLVGETRGQVRAVYLRDQLSRTVAARDVDGDGLDDVWSWGSSSTAYDGNVYLLAGGSSAFDGGTHDVREVALGWWTDARDDGDVIALIAGGDVTGDGLGDAIFVTKEDNPVLAWRPFVGETTAISYSGSFLDLPETLWNDNESSQLSLADADFVGDLDGDGIDELLLDNDQDVGTNGATSLLEGEDLLVEGGNARDLAVSLWYDPSPAPSSELVGVDESQLADDVDGDGLVDLALTVALYDDDGDGGQVCTVVVGGAMPSGDVSPLELGRACPPHDAYYVYTPTSIADQWIPDVDDDGVNDLVYYNHTDESGDDKYRCILRTSLLAPGATLDGFDAGALCTTLAGPLAADLTGDGLPEWLTGDSTYDDPVVGTDAGQILIAEGFEIPWDDASKW